LRPSTITSWSSPEQNGHGIRPSSTSL
jgi:hypothetical protein